MLENQDQKNNFQQLEQAYRETSFRVFEPAFVISIGTQNPELSNLLAQHEENTWAYITAHNPRSKLFSVEVNQQRHGALVERVEELGLIYFEGAGVGSDSTWPPEVSLLILGISKAQAEELGRRFEQNCIVYGSTEESAYLLWCVTPS
ncbi:MAG: DUF3293 domain-containing protein [Bdellovibrionales bacterium]|nr:DUF3293 domain-containing protein [Bdellovibrionales bacterium]